MFCCSQAIFHHQYKKLRFDIITKENKGNFLKPVILFCISGQQELHKEGQ